MKEDKQVMVGRTYRMKGSEGRMVSVLYAGWIDITVNEITWGYPGVHYVGRLDDAVAMVMPKEEFLNKFELEQKDGERCMDHG